MLQNFTAFRCAVLLSLAVSAAAENLDVRVDDAFAKGSPDEQQWSIGSASVQADFTFLNGEFLRTRLVNASLLPQREYLSTGLPFGVDPVPADTAIATDSLWQKSLSKNAALDPAADALQIQVKQGDRIGFSVATGYDDREAIVEWATTLDYGDGTRFASTDDPSLAQGPVWFHYIGVPNSASMDLMDEMIPAAPPSQDAARVPAGFRAPGECPSLGSTKFHPKNAYVLTRVWQAPKDGIVSIQGQAKHIGGNVDASLRIFRWTNPPDSPNPLQAQFPAWALVSGSVNPISVGGRPAVQLDLTLRRDALQARFHIQAFPGVSIFRLWTEYENTGDADLSLNRPAPLSLSFAEDQSPALTHYWMCGGTSRPNQGQLESANMANEYRRTLLGEKTDNYVPWTAISRRTNPKDGWFAALEYLGTWTMSAECADGQLRLDAALPALAQTILPPDKTLTMPKVTLGAFCGNLDDMSRQIYNWQYEYLWDYANSDYFARTKWAVAWFFCSRNLQEQFTARLAGLDMDADIMRELGIEILWDDAGWSRYPTWPIPDNYSVVFSPSFEGPDFAESLRYFNKMYMNWLVWTAGRPPLEMLNNKAGAWGDFQWRTDGVGRFAADEEQAFRNRVESFLNQNPGCSFHTCDGGSRYAHTFEIQRYADVNYLSDGGRGPQTNHFFSYLDLPDRWLDTIDVLMQNSRYQPETAPGQLSMVPTWYARADEPDRESIRRLMEIYRYLREMGVTGRWSFMMHPRVKGESEDNYDQRISHDRKRACIITKKQAKDPIVIYPQGLLPKHNYVIGFESTRKSAERNGADLMANGIDIKQQAPGEIIYLGLPLFPGFAQDANAPTAPGRAIARPETNIGHSGVGVYWSPGVDDQWISYYEVQRGDTLLGKASTGTYFFDHSAEWDPNAAYAVRTIDGAGNASPWTTAQASPNEIVYAALGGLFSETGRDGWGAESSSNENAYTPMTFIPPAKSPAGDFGGTPNQPGGVEGYWEGPGLARVGRGWQQASPETACIRTWTAPKSGTIRVTGRAMREFYRQTMGNPLRVRILLGDKQVWPDQDWAQAPVNDLVGAAHDLSLDVAAGQILRFVLDRGDNPDTDILVWMPRIAYIAETVQPTESVVRILCGAKTSFTDSTGNTWSEDQYFDGGDALSSDAEIHGALPAGADQPLYQSGRQGDDFSYTIPVEPGRYSIRLKFAETKYEWFFERPFNVQINGRTILKNFDIAQTAKGPQRACERAFHHLVPNAEGKFVLRFSGGFEPKQETKQALINAIEILPETRTIVRIDAGADAPFIDWNSQIWAADTACDGGANLTSSEPVQQASPTLYDQALYQTARTGKALRYAVSVSPGLYTVHLKFAELWLKESGQRPMNITINGQPLRENWDPATAAGKPGLAADIRAQNVTPDKDNQIILNIEATGNNDAILQAIEIE